MVEFNKFSAGKVVKNIRNGKGISQKILSGLAGLGRSHLAMIESGKKQPNFETIWKIANAFEMPVHKLVMLIEEDAKSQNK
ncbi:MAG: helix-turn-helix transcriptional regulator [Clostridia bacterium]|nr:helix-turn-helix transcriptional regulator [Clostridia bacterium]